MIISWLLDKMLYELFLDDDKKPTTAAGEHNLLTPTPITNIRRGYDQRFFDECLPNKIPVEETQDLFQLQPKDNLYETLGMAKSDAGIKDISAYAYPSC